MAGVNDCVLAYNYCTTHKACMIFGVGRGMRLNNRSHAGLRQHVTEAGAQTPEINNNRMQAALYVKMLPMDRHG